VAPHVGASKLWYLKRINLFSELRQSELQELDRITRMYEVAKKQAVYIAGDPGSTVFLLKKGRVKVVSHAPSGKELTFEILEPGEIFGEVEALEGMERDSSAEAVEDSLLCAIRREDFERYLRQHPDLSFKLTKLMGFRLRRIRNRVEDLVFRDVPARLAHLLLDLSKSDGERYRSGVRLKIRLSQQEIANLIGCSRETISLVLRQFKEKGLIQIEGHTIVILDQYQLSRLVS
jgi:CRP/FNR family cyclic AMP-dependent transcriptional regulator